MSTRTWKPARMAGSCRNGAERDKGRVVHSISSAAWAAATSSVSMARARCEAKPRQNSAGWEAMTEATPVTCEKCLAAAAALVTTPTVTIESGIAPPPRQEKTVWPFSDMHVGDSFLVPDGMRKKVASVAQFRYRQRGQRFSVRSMPDGTVRCFRLT